MQAAKINKTKKIIHTSTSEVYGTAKYVPIDEIHPLNAQSPYSASKISADHIVQSFFNSFNLPVVTLRPFNSFGPRQSLRAIIPTIISQLLSNQKELKLGDILTTRDFNYVEDTVEGIIALSKNLNLIGRVFNIGTGKEWSIEETAKKIMELVGKEVPIIIEEKRKRPMNSEVERLLADNRSIISETGWKPMTSLEKGLTNTINWIGDAFFSCFAM